MAGGSPPRTSPSPPVLLQGAISAPTKTTFMPPVEASRTTWEGSLRPPGRCVPRACLAAPVRMVSLSAAAGGRVGVVRKPPRRNADRSAVAKPARVVVIRWLVARAAMSNEVKYVAADQCTVFRFNKIERSWGPP
jgi:hypothetical protein